MIYAFNGDADGLCALQQLRLATPGDARLVTGVKREIALLDRISAEPGEHVIVLDVSFDINRASVLRLLASGANILYFDHHFSGDIPSNSHLATFINTSPDICTSIIVDCYLQGKHKEWAIVGAFGDGMPAVAQAMAMACGISEERSKELRALGVCLNYNAYGETEADLLIPPISLAHLLMPHESPFGFIKESVEFGLLQEGYERDLANARNTEPYTDDGHAAVFILPKEKWSRRVNGVFGNWLAEEFPNRAHAILYTNSLGEFTVSVRAAMSNKRGADTFCRSFPTGGGRQGAAGINQLPTERLDEFVSKFQSEFGNQC
ncbi:MAG: hypothetical protein R3E40_11145 [Rhodocyclaceae bacterium]